MDWPKGINMINFCDEMTVPVNKGRAVDIVCLDFSKVFDNVTHSILTDKWLVHRMNGQWGGLSERPGKEGGDHKSSLVHAGGITTGKMAGRQESGVAVDTQLNMNQ